MLIGWRDKDIICGAEGITECVNREIDKEVVKGVRYHWIGVIREYMFKKDLSIDLMRGGLKGVRGILI